MPYRLLKLFAQSSTLAASLALLFLCPTLQADILNIPDDYETIGGALVNAQDDDTLLVQPGTYDERIDFSGLRITLASRFIFTGDPEDIFNTVIDGGDGGRVVTFNDEETAETVMVGFSITGGSSLYGGGIYINGSSPTLKFLVIYENNARAGDDRGGYGGGLYLTQGSSPTLINLTVTDNSADESSGGLHTFAESDATIVNCIFWNNDQNSLPNNLDVTYSCIEGDYEGNGNINDNPDFIAPGDDDYRLSVDSPCIDSGDEDSPNDRDDTQADMGALYFERLPQIEIDREILDCGEVVQRNQASVRLTISNIGHETLVLDSAAIEPEDSPFSFVAWDEPLDLEPNDEHDLMVTFSPVDTGAHEAVFHIYNNDPDNPVIDVNLTGYALQAFPGIAFQPEALGFGPVRLRGEAERTLTIINTGLDTLIVDSMTIHGRDSSEFHFDFNEAISVPPHEEHETAILLAPLTLGNKEATMVVGSNDPENPMVEVDLFGVTVLPDPHFEFASNTGVDHTILVVSAIIDGFPLTVGDEVGVFTPDGLCAGGGFWEEDRMGFSVWGDDEMTEELDGFRGNEEMSFSLWDIETESEEEAQVEFIEGNDLFRSQGISVVELTRITPGEFVLHLIDGWAVVSAPIIPDETEVESLWSPLVESETIFLLKDYQGNFFYPIRHFNNIPFWNFKQGYQLKMSESDTLLIAGLKTPENTPIELHPGWFMVAYFPTAQSDARTAFSTITDDLIIAKDSYGGFYVPEENFNTMAPLRQGRGYQISLNDEATLVWTLPEQFGQPDHVQYTPVKHFSAPKSTGENMSLIVKSDLDHALIDEIGVFTRNGLCIGAVATDNPPPWGLSIWGDDITTPHKDGALDGESLHFRILRNGVEETAEVEWTRGGPEYRADDIGIVGIVESVEIPYRFNLDLPHPNPFNSQVELTFTLATWGEISLIIYDLSGREITRLIEAELHAGSHKSTWTANGAPTGIYLARLSSATATETAKLILLK